MTILIDDLRRKSRRRRETQAALARADTQPAQRRNDLLPGLDLVERPLSDLRPPVRNVRPLEPAHIREIAASISTLGFCAPVLIDQQDRVLDGWARVEAARQVGLARLPCILAAHLTPAERRLLRIALNRLGEKGSWDLDELKLELGELVIEDAPIEVSGFSAPELDQILLDDEPEPEETGPLAPEAGLDPIARPGDIFSLGPHRVACGDARDCDLLARLMAGKEARIVLTDVPYNVPIRGHVSGGSHREFAMASGEMTPEQFRAFNAAWIETALPYLVDGGVLGTFIDWRGYPTMDGAAEALKLESLNLIVWTKSNAGMGSLYRSAHELLPLYKKGTAAHVNNIALGRHGRWRSNVWPYPGASSMGSDARAGLQLHPTVKPVAMLEDAVLDLSHRGEIVIDPFLGSGSTLLAAERSGRVCCGIELDPLYVDVVLRRYQGATGRVATLIHSTDAASPE